MSWLVWYEPKALIMGKKDTKKNNMFRNCNKFSPGARGVFHMEAPGSVQEPGDEFFYCWFSPGARGWICYWRSRISPGVSSCWSSCTSPSSFLVSPIVPPTGNPHNHFPPWQGQGEGGDKHVFCMRRGYGNAMGIFSQEGGAIQGFETPTMILGFFEKKFTPWPWVNGGKCGFLLQKGLGGCQGYLLPRGGGNPRFWKPY